MKKLIDSKGFLMLMLTFTTIIATVVSKDLTIAFFTVGIIIGVLTDKPIKKKQKSRAAIYKLNTIPQWGINEKNNIAEVTQ